MVERCNEDMEVKKVTDLAKDLGWDEDRKALDNMLARDVLEAFEEISPAELVKHWRITACWTDEKVKQELRELYETLPRVKLKAWERVNIPVKNKKARVQLRFAESFANMFGVDDLYVVDKHVVQETVLPVYMLTLPEVEITFSSDFCGWEVEVDTNLEFLNKTEKFFAEFKKDVKTFSENKLKFSIRLSSDRKLYDFMKKIKEYLES